MSDPAIFRATYHKDVDVPSRNVRQIVLEIPSEQTELALKVLGKRGSWVAVARLDPENAVSLSPDGTTERPPLNQSVDGPAPRPAGVRGKPDTKQRWQDCPLSKRAAIMCGEPEFWAWASTATYQGRASPGAADKWNALQAAEWLRHRTAVGSRKEYDTDPAAAQRYLQIERAYYGSKVDAERYG